MNAQNLKKIFGSFAKDLWILILDILAVNLSYYLALLIRFYVNNEFRPTVKYYLSDFARFAPFYTILCILVFALFRLYNGMWRYAGINDMNRIIGASAVTCALQIAGTLIFIRRMPITYYVIGAVLQFIFVVLIRFVYRIIIVEKKRIGSRNLPAVNVMIIGAGEIGRRVIKQLEETNAFRPVCVMDHKSETDGKTFDGIPVLSGGAQLEAAVTKYGVKTIIVAEPALSTESRANIKRYCEANHIDLQDYTGYLANLTGRISLTALLETVKSPVTIRKEKQSQDYPTGEAALQSLTDRYTINSISASGNKIVIDLTEPTSDAFPGYESWMQKHKEETGEEVSYF